MSSGRAGDSGPEDARVDEIRRRLRSLGYLDAGIDRFVLHAAARRQDRWKIALHASARIGALAGVLLGPPAAIGLAVRMPGLVTGPRDAIVAAIYLALLLGAASAVAAFGAAVAASWLIGRSSAMGDRLARRVRALSNGAGVLVSIASLTYLTLWWGAASGGAGWSGPLWTGSALLLAVAISFLLGRAVSITAAATTIAGSTDLSDAARSPRRSWRAVLVGAAMAFAGASALLVATSARPEGTRGAALTVRSTGARLLVLGIDGFDTTLAERVGRAAPPGRHTLLASLAGARLDLAPSQTTDPARLWTTIATGRSPEAHGVEGLQTRQLAGLRGRLRTSATGRVLGAATDVLRLTRPAAASNFERRVKTFWEVAEEAGLRAGVVNWWATWPAHAATGRVITDRAVLRLERGGPLDAEIAPPALYEELRARWPDVRGGAQRAVAAHFQSGEFVPHLTPPVRQVLARSGDLDATIVQLAEATAEDADLDVLAVYLPGLDIAQHSLLGSETAAPSPSELDARVAALEDYYRFLDALTAGIIARWREAGNVIVITQPGRLHQGRGTAAGSGRDIAMSASGAAEIVDIAPTILHLLGIPVARDLDGAVATNLLDRDAWASHSIRFVESYGVRTSVDAARGSAPLDREAMERLRSLGYIR